MNDPDNFLARWSRRKREVADAEKTDASRPAAADRAMVAEPSKPATTADRVGDAEAPFDLSKLPSLESITAETDIRAFFAPGVPEEVTRAALRRAWAADPKIRDFVGLDDYAWDFNAPETIPGFGKLEMTDAMRREVMRIVGGFASPTDPPGTASPLQPPDVSTKSTDALPPSQAGTDVSAPLQQQQNELPKQSQDFAAAQKESAPPQNVQTAAKRGHGGALPQ